MPNFAGGQAGEVTDPFQTAIQTLSIEKKQLYIDKTEALKDHQATLEALKREQVSTLQLERQLEQNTTLSDNLQRKLQGLQLERATLQSSTSHIGETLLNSYFHGTFWNQTFASCQLQCATFDRKQLWTVWAWVASTEHNLLLSF